MQTTMTSPSESPLVTDSVGETESVVECVVQAVAAVENDEVDEMPPITSVIDPDALSDLFENNGTVGHVSFRYHDHRIVVTASGDVSVY